MSKPQKDLANQLTAAVAPVSGDGVPTKAVVRTLRQLAKQLTKQQSKQAKVAQQPTPLTAKRARKALAGELVTALQPYLGADEAPEAKTSKSVTKAVKRLAAQLVKERRKQAKQTVKQVKQDKQDKQTAKQAAKSTVHHGDENTATATVVRKPAARPSAPVRARRPGAAAKRATPLAATQTPAENA